MYNKVRQVYVNQITYFPFRAWTILPKESRVREYDSAEWSKGVGGGS